jgi:hypothetical protein
MPEDNEECYKKTDWVGKTVKNCEQKAIEKRAKAEGNLHRAQ